MKELTRRDILKLMGVGFPGLMGSLKHFGERLEGSQAGELESGQWLYPTNVILVPIRKDWSYDDTGSTQRLPIELQLSDQIKLQVRGIHDFQLHGMHIKVGEIPFMGGFTSLAPGVAFNADQYMGLSVLELDRRKYYGAEDTSKEGELGGFTGIWKDSQSPAGMWNILESVKNLLVFQEENGGFPGGDYSFLKIQKPSTDRNRFITNEENYVAPGVGACATLLSKSLYSLVQRGDAQYVLRVVHDDGLEYFDGPAAPEITEEATDATKDFSWRFTGPGKKYLSVDSLIIPDTERQISGKAWNIVSSDARLILTMTWSTSPPPSGQIENIGRLQYLYGSDRATSGSAGLDILSGRNTEKIETWNDIRPIIEYAYPEFTTRNFQSELTGLDNGEALQKIKNFLREHAGTNLEAIGTSNLFEFYYALIYYSQKLVQDYDYAYPYTAEDETHGRSRPQVKLGTYMESRVKADGVYEPLSKKLYPGLSDPGSGLHGNFKNLDDNTYIHGDQSIQCVGWVSFLGGLGLPISPKYIGNTNADSASGLVTIPARENLKHVKTFVDPDRSEFTYWRIDRIDEAKIGDSFIRWGDDSNNHIGTIVGKKIVNGETVLLATDANRKEDGKIRVFEIDKINFRVIFGEPASPLFPIVIRNNKVQEYLSSQASITS